MTNHRIGLSLLLVAVAIAGGIAGYALAGLTDSAPLLAQPSVTAPAAVATLPPTPTSSATPAASPSPTMIARNNLPLCSNPAVPVGALCLPIYLTPPECDANAIWYTGQNAEPCRKRKTYP